MSTATVAVGAPARWATARSPERPTSGPAVAKIAKAMGIDLMPWQRQVLDVALERMPDGSWAYTDVTVTVPRQSGKTTMWHPLAIHRAATRPMTGTWFTAQTRQKARDHLVTKAGPRFNRSLLARTGKLRTSQGSEGIYFHNGSAYRVFAPDGEDLHGEPNELVGTDEVWVWDDVEAALLRQAIIPTFTTTGGQWWKFSTQGTADSTMLNELVARGRAAVEAGVRQRTAYFEWSLPDEHVDAVEAGLGEAEGPAFEHALALLLAAHPGHGFTLRVDALRAAIVEMRSDGVASMLRAYGNRATAVTERVIPSDSWAACRWPADGAPWPRPAGPVALAFEVALDRVDGAITATWRDEDGHLLVDVVDARPGDPATWMPARVLELRQRWNPVGIGCDSVGPVVDVGDTIARAGVELTRTTAGQYAASCAGTLADILGGRLRHRGQAELDDAVRNAAKRTMGEGWGWGRRSSGGSIAALVAATVGRYVLDNAPEPVTPRFRAGRG